jgi:hypothetical protein
LLCSKVTAAVAEHFLIQIKHRRGEDPTVPGLDRHPEGFALRAGDATGLVHALLLRTQALLLPIKTLVLSGD